MIFRSIKLRTAAIFVAANLGARALPVHADEPDYITMRATSGVSDEVIDYVARNSELITMQLNPKEAATDFIRSICGSYTDSYAKVFFEFNPKLPTPSSAIKQSANVPACLKWLQNATAVVLPSENLDQLLRRKVGKGSDDLFACATPAASARCSKSFRELVQSLNQNVNLDDIHAGQAINLPIVTYPITFRVKQSIHKDAAEVQQDIIAINSRSVGAPALLEIGPSNPIDLIAPVSSSEVPVKEPACVMPPVPWPYDTDRIGKTLEKDVVSWKAAGNAPNNQIVTVVDTGVETDPKGSNSVPRDFIKYINGKPDAIGTQSSLHYGPYPNDEEGEHGTNVANIITGGAGLRPLLQKYLPNTIKVNFVNVRTSITSGPYTSYTITEGSVYNAVAFALAHGARIVNLSIEARDRLDVLKDASNFTLLFVVAAGNDRKSLGQWDTYPANYGGQNPDTGNHFITVAASDGDGNLAYEFSNYSAYYADLVAPGCAVPFLSGASGAGHHGTSFAAPLVSMTAALLGAFGVGEQGPKAIKNRLHVSVDFDPNLADRVVWSGRLNIVKALSLYEDVLETTTSGIQTGLFQFPNGIMSCNDQSYDMRYVKKIWMRDKASGRLGLIVADDQGNLHDDISCAPSANQLSLSDDKGSAITPVPWDNFTDYVPRYYSQ
jgi:hypothetical protein